MLQQKRDHKFNTAGPKGAIDPVHANFGSSEYVIALVQGSMITPMEPIEVVFSEGDTVHEAHEFALNKAMKVITDFKDEHDLDDLKYVMIDRLYDLPEDYGMIAKEIKYICLDKQFQFIIRHQFIQEGAEDMDKSSAKVDLSLQVGFLSFALNSGEYDFVEDILNNDSVSVEVKAILALQGHLKKDLDWLEKSEVPGVVSKALQHAWGVLT